MHSPSVVRNSSLGYIWLAIWMISVVGMATFPSQSDFGIYLPFLCIAFTSYAYLIIKELLTIKTAVILGIIARVMLVFSFPNLSDDVYRFIWDGRLILQGMNPYSMLPSEVLSLNISRLDPELYSKLNSPDYYSVYPPVAQLIYSLGALADSWYWSSVIMKITLLVAEICSIFLIIRILNRLKLPSRNVLIYALNPLILVELMANMHFEGVMICFLLLALYFLLDKKMLNAGIWLAMSIGTKLLPLMFAPLIWKYTKHNKLLFISCFTTTFILFIPVISSIEITNFLRSIDLYFGKFEFNGGIYYLLREIGRFISGYNLIRYIGPLMGIVTLIVLYKKYQKQNQSYELLLHSLFTVFTVYILLTTTLHPWYLAIPIALSCFLKYRFILIWSFLICLTYINYSYPVYQENYWVVALEYSLVLVMLSLEYRRYYLPSSQAEV